MATLILFLALASVSIGARINYNASPYFALMALVGWVFWIFCKHKLFALPIIIAGSMLIGCRAAFLSQPLTTTYSGTFRLLLTADSDVRSDRTYLFGDIEDSPIGLIHVRVQAPRYPIFKSGEIVQVRGSIQPARSFLRNLSIVGEMRCKDPPTVLNNNASPPNYFLLSRKSIEGQINDSLPEPESSFLSGLLLGSKRSIPQQVQLDLQATGTSHLVAISGTNVTFLLSFIGLVFPVSTNKRRAVLTIAIALLLSLLTGSSSSVVRGAIMATIPAFASACGRPVHPLTSILLAGYCMLLNNPLIIWHDSGFQLSFSAFLGVAYLQPILKKLIVRFPETIRESLPVSAFVETTAASFGTAPVMAMNGNPPLTVLGFIANPLVLWIVPIATVFGLALLLTSFIPMIGPLFAQLCWVPLTLILTIIHQTTLLHV